MVAPLLIIGIIAVLGAVVVFTPVGDTFRDVLKQTGFIGDPESNPIQEVEVEKESDVVEGFEAFIHEMIDVGSGMGNDAIESTDFEGNVIGMTKDEAVDINDKGKDFFTAFAEVFFTGHAFIVSVINGLSPVALGLALVSIIALLVTLWLMISHSKHIAHHWLVIVMVVALVVLFLIFLGSEASI